MKVEWTSQIGPASVLAIVQIVAVAVGGVAAWVNLSNKVDYTSATLVTTAKESRARDKTVAEHTERLGKIDTSLGFIVPSIQRIESKLDRTSNQ